MNLIFFIEKIRIGLVFLSFIVKLDSENDEDVDVKVILDILDFFDEEDDESRGRKECFSFIYL